MFQKLNQKNDSEIKIKEIFGLLIIKKIAEQTSSLPSNPDFYLSYNRFQFHYKKAG